MAQMVKSLLAMPETHLDQEDPLEKGMATYSSILTWRIPWTEEPGGLWVHGIPQKLDTTERLSLSLFTFIILVLR